MFTPNNLKTIDKMTEVDPQLLIATLNVNSISSPFKRYRLVEQIFQKEKERSKTLLYAAYKKLTLPVETQTERIEKDIHANGNQKYAQVAILTSGKIQIMTKKR